MARVKSVIIKDPPPLPGEYTTKEGALAAKPDKVVVIGSTSTERKACNAAAALNMGLNENWPSTDFYATWCPNPEPESDRDTWFVLVGRVGNLPDALRKRVENPEPKGRRGPTWTGPRLREVADIILMDPEDTVSDEDDAYKDAKLALAANPTQTVVDGEYFTERSAKLAADRVNADDRAAWPRDTYYGVWGFDPDATGEKFVLNKENGVRERVVVKGMWQLQVGLRSHLPEMWRRKVNGPGSRRRRAAAALAASDESED